MKIGMVLPVMRRNLALKVLSFLNDQTLKLDQLILIDQENQMGDLDFSYYNYEIYRIVPPGGNIGTNQAWNKMWSFKDYDFVGMIGDDYTFGPNLIEVLVNSFSLDEQIGGTTATIFKNRIIRQTDPKDLQSRVVSGKSHMGAALFKNELIQLMPEIPKEFFIFYGDNWLGYWINWFNNKFCEVNVGIRHDSRDDLKVKLNYKKQLRSESRIWNAWVNNHIILSNQKFKEL